MRLGFHTNAFGWAGEKNLLNVARFAHDNGFDFLEVGPTFPLEKETFLRAQEYGQIESFCFCRNFCDDEWRKAEEERKELYRRMEFASSIGVKRIVISTGISQRLSATDHGGCNPLASLDVVASFLNEALERAGEYGVELALENCPMQRNIATSPFMLRRIFQLFPGERLSLCYDPSHTVWQLMDVYSPLEEFGNRIHHVHIKDTHVFKDKLRDVGIMHNTASDKGFDENQWWRHTIFGDGDIDWKRFLSSLDDDVFLSFELEDFNYEGNVERVKEGILIQKERLLSVISETK